MTFQSFVFLLTSVIYINLGLFLLYRDGRSAFSRGFFWACLMLSIWAFSTVFGYGRFPAETVRFWTTTAYIAQSCFVVFMLRFFVIFTGRYPKGWKRMLFIVLIFLLPAALTFRSVFYNSIVSDFPAGFWFLLFQFTVFSYNIASLFLVLRWHRMTKSKREKKQAQLFAISAIAAIAAAWIVDLAAAHFGKPAFSPVTTLIWLFCVVYIILRYRFIQLTPKLVSPDILDAVHEMIMLVDSNKKVITLNRKGTELFGFSPRSTDELAGKIDDFSRLDKIISTFPDSDDAIYFFRVFLTETDSIRPLDIRIKKIHDKFGEVLGMLITGTEVAGMEHFRKTFDLTSRQAEVVVLLLSGLSNREIAERMFVSERTIKGHLTNIYTKLRISNKIELYNLGSGFNLT
ncbi:MAG: PAS domain-containing protein [Spirochaetales bacterium]|nr:PAS domain-containing protein [Spirochaetales bacterium]